MVNTSKWRKDINELKEVYFKLFFLPAYSPMDALPLQNLIMKSLAYKHYIFIKINNNINNNFII